MSRARPRPEVELGQRVVAWLAREGFEVFQEVMVEGHVIDIIARKRGALSVFELKRGPSLDLLAQIVRWRLRAEQVSAATWRARSDGFHAACEALGLGWYVAPEEGSAVVARVEPATRKVAPGDALTKHLHERQKSAALAGGKRGGAWAPWRGTAEQLTDIAKQSPGIELGTLCKMNRFHYVTASQARAGVQFMIKRGLIPGVELVKNEAGRLALRPSTSTK